MMTGICKDSFFQPFWQFLQEVQELWINFFVSLVVRKNEKNVAWGQWNNYASNPPNLSDNLKKVIF